MITLTRDAASYRGTYSVGGAVDEQYRSLIQVFRPAIDQPGAVATIIGVAACEPGAGVSTVAMNLAIAGAQSSERPVLLLDLSSSRSALGARFGVSDELGLRDALAEDVRPSDCVKPSPITNLSLLGMCERGNGRTLSIGGGRLSELLRSLEHDFGFIVVDLPITDSALCVAMAGQIDGVLLVLESERTNSEVALRSKRRLIESNARLLGVIFNKHHQHLPRWLDARL